MKRILAALIVALFAVAALAADEPLFPDGVNQILGRVKPGLAESKLEEIVQTYYLGARAAVGDWSGRTGYVTFRLTSRYSLCVAEYSDPKDLAIRFVHTDMLFYLDDSEQQRRISISLGKWDDQRKPADKPADLPASGYWPPAARVTAPAARRADGDRR